MKINFIALALVLIIAACSNGDGRESFGDKSEWSILQGVEYENRDKPIKTPEQITVQGYDLLGVRNIAGTGNIWIMLWPKSAPFYKQMPSDNFVVQKSLLNELAQQHHLSSTVEEALNTHVPK